MNTNTPAVATENLIRMTPFPDRQTDDDPFARLIDASGDSEAVNAPMVKMGFEVTIRGGLALVKVERTYVNSWDEPIEALMSIPVPVQAAFFGLSAVIGGKSYQAMAQPKANAREFYEQALDTGKAAVLHEELLRGIHSLSVGNLGAGESAVVTSHYAEPLRFFEDTGQLRIPLTVGDVYGVSPLEDVDTLEAGGPVPKATLRIEHDAHSIDLAGGTLQPEDGGALFSKVPGNAPIELKVVRPKIQVLKGHAADGRQVELRITPKTNSAGLLTSAVLVDRSGSMSSYCEGTGASLDSIHEAVVRGLKEVAHTLRSEDRLSLWEFDDSCQRVGKRNQSESPEAFVESLSELGGPRGGTRIGHALEQVMAAEKGKDILLLTDGQSYDLDIHRLAKAGHRIFVVLIGEGSLEANVGHLAALTGGDVHFSFGDDVGTALQACLQGMRQERAKNSACRVNAEGHPLHVRTTRCNAAVSAKWSVNSEPSQSRSRFAEAIAAYAASLAFASTEEALAVDIAIGEGLVTHLTSLVLVTEGVPEVESLPKTVKQTLPHVRTAQMSIVHHAPSVGLKSHSTSRPMPMMGSIPRDSRATQVFSMAPPSSPRLPFESEEVDSTVWGDFVWLGRALDWQALGSELAEGEWGNVPADCGMLISDLADYIEEHEDDIGASATDIVIALTAYAVRESDRFADRVFRRITKKMNVEKLEDLVRSIKETA